MSVRPAAVAGIAGALAASAALHLAGAALLPPLERPVPAVT